MPLKIYLRDGGIPSCFQSLLQALSPGITPGKAQRNICGPRDQNQARYCKAMALPTILIISGPEKGMWYVLSCRCTVKTC